MGWKVFRQIARPFERAAHGVGLSGGGVTRKISRQVTRSSRDVGSFAFRAGKNITAFQASAATLGLYKPKWSGTATAATAGQAAAITAVVVGGGYAVAPYFTAPAAVTPAAGVPLASAAPYAVETGVSYGTIGTMGSGFAAGNVPLATTVSTAVASPATKGFFTTLGEKALSNDRDEPPDVGLLFWRERE